MICSWRGNGCSFLVHGTARNQLQADEKRLDSGKCRLCANPVSVGRSQLGTQGADASKRLLKGV